LQGGQQCWALWAFLAACRCTLFIDIISLCLLIGQIKMLACLSMPQQVTAVCRSWLERLSILLYRLLFTVGLTTVTLRWLSGQSLPSETSVCAEHGWVRRCEHITPVLEDLHWLPVSQRVVFKTALMVCKCVHGIAPAYLSDLCVPATAISGRQHLRSAATGTQPVPRAWTATGQRSFAVNGPATCLLLAPRSLDLSESTFKRVLKTHLFSTARLHWDIFMILAPDINIQTYLPTYLSRLVMNALLVHCNHFVCLPLT